MKSISFESGRRRGRVRQGRRVGRSKRKEKGWLNKSRERDTIRRGRSVGRRGQLRQEQRQELGLEAEAGQEQGQGHS